MKIYGNYAQPVTFGTLRYNIKSDPQDKLAKYAQYYKTSAEYKKLTQQIKDSDKVVTLSDSYDNYICADIKGSNERLQGTVMEVLKAAVKRISPDYEGETKARRQGKNFN